MFAWLWPLLDRAGLNPSTPAKFGWGLIFAGLSFGVLLYAAANTGEGIRVSVWWLVLAYFVLELGEMVLSPIGVLSGDVFALTGWMRSKLGQAPQAMSWRIEGGVLTDYRIEPVVLAEGRGLSRDREGNLVFASLMTNGGQLDAWSFAFAGWAAPKVWNAAPYGTPEGWDGYTADTCTNWGYCLDGGFLTIDGALVGLLRLHNP